MRVRELTWKKAGASRPPSVSSLRVGTTSESTNPVIRSITYSNCSLKILMMQSLAAGAKHSPCLLIHFHLHHHKAINIKDALAHVHLLLEEEWSFFGNDH